MYSYLHGGNAVFEPDRRDILDLSANINPLGCPEGVAEAIKSRIPSVTRYPDSMSQELRGAIAAWERISPEEIFCGGGASDIIFRLPVCLKPGTALLTAPAFSDYERALRVCGAEITRLYLTESQGFRPDGRLIRAVAELKPDMLFLCNPNNPTGVLAERGLMEELLAVCKEANTVAVVDECFMDFVENAESHSLKPLLKSFGNLVILKAFTKTFALPGIRLGYALCSNAEIIDGLYESGPDWAVSSLAQAAGVAALGRAAEYLRDSAAFVARERAFIKEGLESAGYIVFDSRANYVFFKNPRGFDLCGRLEELNIRIRNCGNYPGLSEDYCRVAVSSTENNRKFIRMVKELWN